jgi:hypothetical protein
LAKQFLYQICESCNITHLSCNVSSFKASHFYDVAETLPQWEILNKVDQRLTHSMNAIQMKTNLVNLKNNAEKLDVLPMAACNHIYSKLPTEEKTRKDNIVQPTATTKSTEIENHKEY